LTTYTLLDDIIPALLELYDVATAAAHDVVIVAARCCRCGGPVFFRLVLL